MGSSSHLAIHSSHLAMDSTHLAMYHSSSRWSAQVALGTSSNRQHGMIRSSRSCLARELLCPSSNSQPQGACSTQEGASRHSSMRQARVLAINSTQCSSSNSQHNPTCSAQDSMSHSSSMCRARASMHTNSGSHNLCHLHGFTAHRTSSSIWLGEELCSSSTNIRHTSVCRSHQVLACPNNAIDQWS